MKLTNIKNSITLVILIALIAIAGTSMIRKHVIKTPSGENIVSCDAMVFMQAGYDLLHGNNIYYYPNGEKNCYVYLPFYAFVNIPSVFLPPLLLDVFWYLLNIVFLVLIIQFSYYLFTGESLKSVSWTDKCFFYCIPIVLSSRYLVRNFQDANINLLVLFLIIWSFYLYEKKKKDWTFILIGFAGAIKVMPLVFVVYFFARKEYKKIVYIVTSFGIATLLPMLLTGLPRFVQYVQEFRLYSQKIFSPSGAIIENFAIWGTLVRLFSHNYSFLQQGEPFYMNLLNASLSVLKILAICINIVLIIYLYWVSRHSLKTDNNQYIKHGALVITLILMNYFSILVEEHHMVSFLVAYLFLFIAIKKNIIFKTSVKWLIYGTGVLTLFTVHDVIVPIAGKQALLELLAFSIPVLPVAIILIFLLNNVLHKQYTDAKVCN